MKHWPLLAALLLPLGGTAHAEKVLRVYNWEAYVDPAVLDEFARGRDVRLDYRTFTDAQQLDDALRRGEALDLVFPTDHQLRELIADGLLAPLERARLRNHGHLDPYLLRLLAASGAERYVAPYMWGTVGLMVNQPLAERHYGGPLPNSWSLLFDPQASARLAGCGVAVLNARQEALSLKMTYKGLRLGASGARRIRQELGELLPPGVRLSPSDYTRFIEQMTSGKVCVAMTWDALLRGEDLERRGLRFDIPEEGGLIFIDSMAIPAAAQQPQLALELIDFLLEPANVARNLKVSHAIPGIREALLEQAGASPQLRIAPELRRRLYLLDPLNPRQREALREAWPASDELDDAPSEARARQDG